MQSDPSHTAIRTLNKSLIFAQSDEFDNKPTQATNAQPLLKTLRIVRGNKLVLELSATQTDFSEFFKAWNPEGKSYLYPDDSAPQYEGGVSASGINKVVALGYTLPKTNPLSINAI